MCIAWARSRIGPRVVHTDSPNPLPGGIMFKVCGTPVEGWTEDDAIRSYCDLRDLDYWDHPCVLIEAMTVREVMVETYGDSWTTAVDHLADLAISRRYQHFTNDRGFRDFTVDEVEVLVLRHTMGRDVHGYADVIDISNYRVLADRWSDCEGLTDGPYSGSDHIALDLDSIAPHDLVDVLRSLEAYPVLDDDEYSTVEMEQIAEHWDIYARRDARSALADALGIDEFNLADGVLDLLESVAFDGTGVTDEWPEMVDSSYVNFHIDEIVEWIASRAGRVVHLGGYRPRTLDLRKRALIAA
ncbi:hypothetical protein SEA_BANTAM_167 [Gordonia phage Bantam]|uniref:Uncharacterized protein n=1 Tax=Gordonia phage Bantam TaxID=1887641 RepID=A0A1B3AYL1_9CAUD|nr:hypothetical protein BIZ77_gp012 [Gordonia phage Bantam]AOE43856.1 hypothetical protein SEA_BANTAM_167 [Gordonia phage Bantam]